MGGMREPVVVVGAGAAGIIAAWRAATFGARVILLEKTNRIGTKILISGGGKCNITHEGAVETVLRAFRPNEARFLRPSCYRFFNRDVIQLLTDRGLEVYTRPNGRVFPIDQTAKDVVAALSRLLDEVGVEARLESPVLGIVHSDGRVGGVLTPSGELTARHVVLCTGGSSYPKSGTTGDGWPWARELGHHIVPVRAALAPIELACPEVGWAGISLRGVTLKARAANKEVARWSDDLLFTHQGVSGPAALEISRGVEEARVRGEVTLEVDLLPAETLEAVQGRLKRAKRDQPNRRVLSLVHGVVPSALFGPVLRAARVSPDQSCQGTSDKLINQLGETLKAWNLGAVKRVPIEKGEVVAGGVSLEEVDPQTMRSRVAHNLSLCGEVLDIAGPVGGYNLQAAFSTGFTAGEAAGSERV